MFKIPSSSTLASLARSSRSQPLPHNLNPNQGDQIPSSTTPPFQPTSQNNSVVSTTTQNLSSYSTSYISILPPLLFSLAQLPKPQVSPPHHTKSPSHLNQFVTSQREPPFIPLSTVKSSLHNPVNKNGRSRKRPPPYNPNHHYHS